MAEIQDYIKESREEIDAGIYDGDYDMLLMLEALQAANERFKKRLDEIAGLCQNCRSLVDAIDIAQGREGTSTVYGCDKCWVDELQAEIKALKDQ